MQIEGVSERVDDDEEDRFLQGFKASLKAFKDMGNRFRMEKRHRHGK